jgi:hypothetical protein
MSKKTVITAAVSALILGGLGVAWSSGIPNVEAVAAAPAVTVTVPGPVTTVTVPGPVTTVKIPGPVTTVKIPGPVKTVTVIKKVAAPAPAPSAVIEDGQWEVGVDVSAGSYKVTAAVDPDAMCYWKITQTGKSDNIIDNDIVTGGKPTVTVKRGQDFTTEDCGTWARVR